MRKLKRSHHFDFMYIKKSAYEPNGPSGRRLIIPFSVAGSDMEYFYSPLDRMLVHRRVNPIIRFVCTHSYTWVERGTVRVKCFAQENSSMSPSVLTMRTPRLSSRFYKLLIIHLLWEHIIDTLHIKLSEFASVTPFVQVLPSSVLCSCRFFFCCCCLPICVIHRGSLITQTAVTAVAIVMNRTFSSSTQDHNIKVHNTSSRNCCVCISGFCKKLI